MVFVDRQRSGDAILSALTMFGKRYNDGPRHPLAAGVFGRFLAASEECLIGRLDESGVVLEANAGLRHWLGTEPRPRLFDALLPSSGERWKEVLALLDAPGRQLAVQLDFGRESPISASFRCLASRDQEGLWLFGERLFETVEPLLREVLAMQGDLARLNRGLRKRRTSWNANARRSKPWPNRRLDRHRQPPRSRRSTSRPCRPGRLRRGATGLPHDRLGPL